MATGPSQSLARSTPEAATLADLLGAAFESLSIGVVLFGRRLDVLVRNQCAKNLLPNEADVSVALSRWDPQSRFGGWASELRAVMDTGRPFLGDVAVQLGKDQHETVFSVTVSPLRPAGESQAIGGLLLLEDVSNRIGMERRLAVSERMAAIGKMAAQVAHELNNPLDGILRYVNLALRQLSETATTSEGPPDAKTMQYLERARDGVQRMGQIISELLTFSRFTPNTVNQATLNKIIEDALLAFQGRIQESNITVVCSFQNTNIPVVRAGNLFQVFCNLIKNAIDAMPEPGTLTIGARTTETDLIVTFEDTGVGLPPEPDRVFEPFFTTKGPGKGTGLGLAVCKELIERYSGMITARSRHPRGSAFTVTLPLKNSVAGQPLQHPSTPAGATEHAANR